VPILVMVSNTAPLLGSLFLARRSGSGVLMRVVASLDIGAPEFIVEM